MTGEAADIHLSTEQLTTPLCGDEPVMKSVPVESAKLRDPKYASRDDAFDAYESNPRRLRIEEHAKRVIGSNLEDYSYDSRAIMLAFSNGYALHLELTQNALDWTIAPSRDMPTLDLADDPYGRVCQLDWGNAITGIWSREELLESRRGKRVWLLSGDFVTVYVYFQDLLILKLGPAYDLERKKMFLRWCETD